MCSVTCAIPPLLVHLQKTLTQNEGARTKIHAHDAEVCMLFLHELGKTYWHADFYLQMFKSAFASTLPKSSFFGESFHVDPSDPEQQTERIDAFGPASTSCPPQSLPVRRETTSQSSRTHETPHFGAQDEISDGANHHNWVDSLSATSDAWSGSYGFTLARIV